MLTYHHECGKIMFMLSFSRTVINGASGRNPAKHAAFQKGFQLRGFENTGGHSEADSTGTDRDMAGNNQQRNFHGFQKPRAVQGGNFHTNRRG